VQMHADGCFVLGSLSKYTRSRLEISMMRQIIAQIALIVATIFFLDLNDALRGPQWERLAESVPSGQQG
jgi:hypothetical protein